LIKSGNLFNKYHKINYLTPVRMKKAGDFTTQCVPMSKEWKDARYELEVWVKSDEFNENDPQRGFGVIRDLTQS